jgi:hypothetical protein
MASTLVYAFTFWTNANMENVPAIQAAVSTTQEVEWTELTMPETVIIDGLALVRGDYPSANEFATITDATAPALNPSASRHFLIAHKTQGGDAQNYVTNFVEPIGAAGLSSLLDWLAEHHPAIRAVVLPSLTAQTTRLQAARTITLAVNPLAIAFPDALT